MSANPTFWIAKGADGVVRGGLLDDADSRAWTCVLTAQGWERVPETTDPPMGVEDAGEALCALVGRAHDAGLHHASVDTEAWPDAPAPWRLEATYDFLWPADVRWGKVVP